MGVTVDDPCLSGLVGHLIVEVSAGYIQIPAIDLNICPLYICIAIGVTCVWAQAYRYIGDILVVKHIHDVLRRGAHADAIDDHM